MIRMLVSVPGILLVVSGVLEGFGTSKVFKPDTVPLVFCYALPPK